MRSTALLALLTLTALAADAPRAVRVDLLSSDSGESIGFAVAVAQADVVSLVVKDDGFRQSIVLFVLTDAGFERAGSFPPDDGAGVSRGSVAADWSRWDSDGDGIVEMLVALTVSSRVGEITTASSELFAIGVP